MAISIEEYLDEQLQEVHRVALAGGTLTVEAFVNFAAELLVEAGELRDFTYAPLIGQRGLTIHGFDSDPKESDNILTVVIADYAQEAPSGSLTQTDLDALLKRATNFVAKSLDEDFRFSLESSSPAWELADLINVRWPYVEKVRVVLVTNKILSRRIDGHKHGEINGTRVTYSVWDLGRFHQLELSNTGREELIIDLEEEFGEGFPAIQASLPGSDYESFLVVVPGPYLASIYDRWHDRLLEQNVRVFLQARSNVNRGIRDTIKDNPEMFFAYNNGISATAESVELAEDDLGYQITSFRNLQIVNGGQTTASIHAASKTHPEQLKRVSVQMKLSIIHPDKAMAVVPKISEYANSQNTVSKADFFSNHPFHVQIENASRRLQAPSADGTFRQSKWFYERARGQYADARGNLTKAKREVFDLEYPKSQFFGKTDLAKFDSVWRMIPHEVSKGAQRIFQHFAGYIDTEWDRNQAQFNDAQYREYIAKAIIFKSTERLVSKANWYEGGYRANIVAYGISKLAWEVGKSGARVDFDRIWKEQAVSESLASALLECSRAAQGVILNPKNVRNISEWAKKEECWITLKDTSVELPENLGDALIDTGKATEIKNDAVKQGKIDLGIQHQVRVMKAGAPFWKKVQEWGNEYRLLGVKDLSILRIAMDPTKLPSEKQATHLMEMIGRLEKEGLPFADEI